jgi:hypothetical protein
MPECWRNPKGVFFGKRRKNQQRKFQIPNSKFQKFQGEALVLKRPTLEFGVWNLELSLIASAANR